MVVVVLWLAVVGAGFGVGIGVFERLVPEVGTVPGSESQRAEQRLEDTAAGAETLTAVISGRPASDPALRADVAAAVAAVREVPGVAAPVLGLRLSEGDPRMLPTTTDTRQLWDRLITHFPDQAGPGDLQIVADTTPGDPALRQLHDQVAALPGVTGVEVQPAGPALTVLTAQPSAPPEDTTARDTVAAIRALPTPFPLQVTGGAARLVDYRAMLAERLPWAITLVTAGTLLLLFAFTGSLLLPVKAVLTSLLSISAALGIVVWVFQHGHAAGLLGTTGLGYVHLSVPILVGAIAFGLSVDYEVFLLSRIREEWLTTRDPRGSVAAGLQHTGRIITAAALVIGVVFAGFIAGGFAPIKAVGLGLVLAIALDATIVRMLLVPATMILLGRRNWWLPASTPDSHYPKPPPPRRGETCARCGCHQPASRSRATATKRSTSRFGEPGRQARTVATGSTCSPMCRASRTGGGERRSKTTRATCTASVSAAAPEPPASPPARARRRRATRRHH